MIPFTMPSAKSLTTATKPKSKVAPTSAPVSVTESAPAVAPSQSEPVKAPVVVETGCGDVPAVPTEEGKAKAKSRKMLTDVVDVTISTARVRTYLSDQGFNAKVHEAMTSLADATNYGSLPESTVAYITSSKPDPVDPKKATEEQKAEASKLEALWTAFSDPATRGTLPVSKETSDALSGLVSRHLLRTGDDAVTAFAATANYVVHELAVHGARALKAEGKKTLQIYHIANDEMESLSIWPLIHNLKTVRAARCAFAARVAELDAKNEEKREKAKLPKKAKADKTEKVEKVAEPVPSNDQPEPTPTEPATEEKKEKKPRDKVPCDEFKHHTFHIFRDGVTEVLGMNEAGKRIGDVSNEVRSFGSHLVFELIGRYAPLVREQSEYAGVKTIKASSIGIITRSFLLDAGVCPAALEAYVKERVAKCLGYVRAPSDKTKPSSDPATEPAKEPTPGGTESSAPVATA